MQDIEKLYKDKLENHESDVSDRVWDNIAIALSEQKKKRRIFLFFAIALVLALLIGYFIVSTKHDDNKKTENPQTEKVIETAILSTEGSNTDLSGIADSKDEPIVTKVVQDDNNKRISHLKAGSDESQHNRNHINHKAAGTKNIYSNSSSGNINISEDDRNNTTVNITDRKKETKSTGNIILADINSIDRPKIFINSTVLNSPFGKKRPGFLNDCFPVKRSFFFMEAYFSNDYNRKVLSGENYVFIKNRNETESNLYSYSFGILGGYLLSNGFNVKIGINYTDINEKFNITFRNVVSTQTVITIDTIKNPDGSITEVRDTTIKKTYGERNVQDENKYSMLDIPLIIGLNYRRFNHKIGISTGVILNIISRQKGTILNHIADTSDLQIIDSDNDIFHRNVGISIYVSLAYSYRFMQRYEVFFEPNIRYYLKSFTKDSYILHQNYTKYGISVGGRYLF